MSDEKYMRRCIELAQNGRNNVATNPMVGAVIVYKERIIGEGYHVCWGHAHAEVNAINAVKDESLLRHSTLYVSLEPCSHYGKTPPCADLIISKQIPRVVIGCKDPFPKVSGRGIAKLREAGVDVLVGVLEEECRQLNRQFILFNTLHRPYIILKWAQSADGFIDYCRTEGKPVRLSTPSTMMLVHKRRAEVDAVMVGSRTAVLDNPSLTVRHWHGRQPIRITLDKEKTLPANLKLFTDGGKTLVFTRAEDDIPSANLEYLHIDFKQNILPQVLDALFQRNIQSLLVEGGRALLQSFIDSNLWDEAFVEHAQLSLHKGVEAPSLPRSFVECKEYFSDVEIEHFSRTETTLNDLF